VNPNPRNRPQIQPEGEAKKSGKKFKPAIEPPYRWRDWVYKSDGTTGDELLAFINNQPSTINLRSRHVQSVRSLKD
jgi:hypothetical protein